MNKKVTKTLSNTTAVDGMLMETITLLLPYVVSNAGDET